MEKIKLIKREYLGEGYHFIFQNNENKTTEKVWCTKGEYEEYSSKNVLPPKKDGYTLVGGAGGCLLVDNETKELKEDEYTIIDDKYLAFGENENGFFTINYYSKEEFYNKFI